MINEPFKTITDKLGILDVVATLDNNKRVNIEMQVKDYYNTIERSVFYGTGVYHENLTSIQNENLEAIRMIDNKYIQKAEDELEYLTGDAETKRLAELREKAIRDEAAGLKAARRVGIQEGEVKGIAKTRKETAKKMLAKGIDIDTIVEITGLTKEKIEKL